MKLAAAILIGVLTVAGIVATLLIVPSAQVGIVLFAAVLVVLLAAIPVLLGGLMQRRSQASARGSNPRAPAAQGRTAQSPPPAGRGDQPPEHPR